MNSNSINNSVSNSEKEEKIQINKIEKKEKNISKIPQLKLELFESIKPLKNRRFSQPLFKSNFTPAGRNNVPIIRYSITNKFIEENNQNIKSNNQNTQRGIYKKHLNQNYLDTIICESKVLMNIIDEAKKSF